MRHQYQPIVLATLLLCSGATSAQDTPAQLECKPLRQPPPRTVTPVAHPEVNVVCGANSITQTFATQPLPSDLTTSPPKRQDDSSSSYMTALISGAAGVLGAFAGAFASFLVARTKAKSDLELETKRLSANIIAAERLRWLQDIRQRLSILFQQLDLQYNVLKRPNGTASQQQIDDMSSEIMAQCNMITLMLNPNKPDQAALRNALQNSLVFMLSIFQQASTGARAFNDAQYTAYKQAAFDAMTGLGVETWKQVKSLA